MTFDEALATPEPLFATWKHSARPQARAAVQPAMLAQTEVPKSEREVLAKAMTRDRRVEVQWAEAAEYEGDARGSRAHITGPDLEKALRATKRPFTKDVTKPELDLDCSARSGSLSVAPC